MINDFIYEKDASNFLWKMSQARMIHFPFPTNSDPFWQAKNLTFSIKMLSTKSQLSTGWTFNSNSSSSNFIFISKTFLLRYKLAQNMKTVAAAILFFNFCICVVIFGIGGWVMNHTIDNGFVIGLNNISAYSCLSADLLSTLVVMLCNIFISRCRIWSSRLFFSNFLPNWELCHWVLCYFCFDCCCCCCCIYHLWKLLFSFSRLQQPAPCRFDSSHRLLPNFSRYGVMQV